MCWCAVKKLLAPSLADCALCRDKDNNSAVISLGGEPCSSETAAAASQHTSSVGGIAGATSDAAAPVDPEAPHRAATTTVAVSPRCGSPPTGRSVSFMCGRTSDAADGRRRPPPEQRDPAGAVVVAVTGGGSSPCTVHYVEDEKWCGRAESSRHAGDATSDVHVVCYCVNSPPPATTASKLSDVDAGCLCWPAWQPGWPLVCSTGKCAGTWQLSGRYHGKISWRKLCPFGFGLHQCLLGCCGTCTAHFIGFFVY